MENTKTKYNAVINCMELQKRDNNDYFAIIKDNTEKDLKDLIINMIYDENIGGTTSQSYDILYDATQNIENFTIEELKDTDIEDIQDMASVYTYDRLAYINNNNEYEIYDILKEYNLDNINTACAIWYDTQVKNAMYKLRAYIYE